jgi:nucleoside-diphosphate-sugar epimerase
VNDLAEVLGRILERPVEKEFLPERTGDVRHSWADVSAARRLLGYEPEVGFEEGLRLTADAFVRV